MTPRRLLAPALLLLLVSAPRAMGATKLALSSGAAPPGGTVVLSITTTPEAGIVTSFDLRLQAVGSAGAPPLEAPSFSVGMDASLPGSEWFLFAQPDPWRCVILDASLTGAEPGAEVARFSVRIPETAPRGAIYTISAVSLAITDFDGWEDREAGVQPGQVSLPNGAPSAAPLTVSVASNTPTAVTLSGSDPDGDPLTYQIRSQPSHGSLSGAAPSLTYTPAPGYSGSDSFTYTVSDGAATSPAATVSLSVVAGNKPPTAHPRQVTLDEDTQAQVTLSGTDPEGNALSFRIVTGPAHGSLTGTAPSVTYRPAANYHGADAFTFAVRDGALESAPATVSITVRPVNDPPNAVDDQASCQAGASVGIPVLLNDSDVDGDTLTLVSVTQGRRGTTTVSGSQIRYAASRGAPGSDSFTYTVSDGRGGLATATVTVSITAKPAPTATPIQTVTHEETDLALRLSGSDPTGGPLSYVVLTAPKHGWLSGTAPDLIYHPTRDYNGVDSFTYAVSDGLTQSEPAAVLIEVLSVNDTPVAQSLNVTTLEDTPVELPLSAVDADGDLLTFELSVPTSGTFLDDGVSFIFVPEPDFAGSVVLSYTATDGVAVSAPASIFITILPVNDNPRAANDTAVTGVDMAVRVAVLANDTDVDGDPLTVTSVSSPRHGTAAAQADGTIRYVPSGGYTGTDSFSYQVSDGKGGLGAAVVTIHVRGGAPPVARSGSAETPEDTPLLLSMPATDPEGDPMTFEVLTPPAHGTLTDTPEGLLYTPNRNYHGADRFTFRASDGVGVSEPGEVLITVTPVNDGPEANPDVLVLKEDQAGEIDLLANDVDVEGDAITLVGLSSAAHGTVTLLPGGRARYVPLPNYSGPDRFTYSVVDARGASGSGTVTVTVESVNDAPTAAPLQVVARQGSTASFELPGSDPDGDPLTYTVLEQPKRGLLEGTPPALRYTPHPGTQGEDSLVYSVSDGQLSATATVTLRVVASGGPVASALELSTLEDTAADITLAGEDPAGAWLTYTVTTAPSHGRLTGKAPRLTYTPAADYHGPDSFSYTVSSIHGTSAPATVSITVEPVNDPPSLTLPRYHGVKEGATLTVPLAAFDPEGQTVTFSLESPPAGAAIRGSELVWTPDYDQAGSYELRVLARDEEGAVGTAPLTITVHNVNRAPVAAGCEVATPKGIPLEMTLSATDPDGQPVAALLVEPPAHGTLTLGQGLRVTYVPDPFFIGRDRFSFQASDGTAKSETATVLIHVGLPVAGRVAPLDAVAAPGEAVDVAVKAEGLAPVRSLRFRLRVAAPRGSQPAALVDVRGSGEVQARVTGGEQEYEVALEAARPVPVQGGAIASLKLAVPSAAAPGTVYQLSPLGAQAVVVDPDGTARAVAVGSTDARLTVVGQKRRGDANGDGTTDVRDMIVAIRLVLRPEQATPEQRSACDLNGDGTLGIPDLVLLVRAVLGL